MFQKLNEKGLLLMDWYSQFEALKKNEENHICALTFSTSILCMGDTYMSNKCFSLLSSSENGRSQISGNKSKTIVGCDGDKILSYE